MTGNPYEPPRWRAALFDLDGTLIDTRPGMRAALEAAFVEVVGTDLGSDRADLSLPLDEMILSADPDVPSPLRQQLSEAYRRHYDSGCWKAADVYPGAEECLRDISAAGVRVFVVTNKRAGAAGRLLEHFRLARYFEEVVGQLETGQPRPKSELARHCMETAGLDPATTVVVGDSNHDATMAALWNMDFIAITSGAGPLGPAQADARRVAVGHLSDAAALMLLRPQGGRREP